MMVRDAIRQIEDEGSRHVRARGSHRRYSHPAKPGLVTVPGYLSNDLAPGTLNTILEQASLK